MAKDKPKDPSNLTGELKFDPLSEQLCHSEKIYFDNFEPYAFKIDRRFYVLCIMLLFVKNGTITFVLNWSMSTKNSACYRTAYTSLNNDHDHVICILHRNSAF